MTGVRISALPPIVTPTLTDFFPVVQSGVTSKETMSQLVSLLGGSFVPIGGTTMTGPLILSGNATLPLQAATYQQIQVAAAGLTVILSTQAGTTANLNATYANGTSGVGATLTNAGTQAAFAVDGYTANANDRILVKNQTSAFANGIYAVTTVGSGSTNWILTRTTDYNTAPAQIKSGTLIVVNNGTTNAGTSWLETATVNTIGTDPIVFSQFTFAPGSYLQRANNLSDVASVPASLVNLTLGVPTGTGNVVRQTSPSIISPSILDTSSNPILSFQTATSAVNYLSISDAATGNAPGITALGTDTNIGINLTAKGLGSISLLNGTSFLAQFNSAASAVNYVSFGAQSTGNAPGMLAQGTDTNINLLLAGKGTGGVQSKGVSNGSNSPVGYIGEIVYSQVVSPGVAIPNGPYTNVTSIAVTPGDWLCFGNFSTTASGATGSYWEAWVNNVSAAGSGDLSLIASGTTPLNGTCLPVPARHFNVTTATTFYLTVTIGYSGGSVNVCGQLFALRIR